MAFTEGVFFVVGLRDKAGVQTNQRFCGDVGDGGWPEVVDRNARLRRQVANVAVDGFTQGFEIGL